MSVSPFPVPYYQISSAFFTLLFSLTRSSVTINEFKKTNKLQIQIYNAHDTDCFHIAWLNNITLSCLFLLYIDFIKNRQLK
jgi:hypothetical protein